MKKLYIANTNFEFELEENRVLKVPQMLEASPICLQLQFLPLLFADKDDEVLVTAIPEHEAPFPKMVLDPKECEINSWGWSKSIQIWAESKKAIYNMPNWEVVRAVNSKEWSFQNSPQMKRSFMYFFKKRAGTLDIP